MDIRGGDYRDDRFLGVYRILKVSSEGMPPLWKENLCVYGAAGDPGSETVYSGALSGAGAVRGTDLPSSAYEPGIFFHYVPEGNGKNICCLPDRGAS